MAIPLIVIGVAICVVALLVAKLAALWIVGIILIVAGLALIVLAALGHAVSFRGRRF